MIENTLAMEKVKICLHYGMQLQICDSSLSLKEKKSLLMSRTIIRRHICQPTVLLHRAVAVKIQMAEAISVNCSNI